MYCCDCDKCRPRLFDYGSEFQQATWASPGVWFHMTINGAYQARRAGYQIAFDWVVLKFKARRVEA